MNKNNNIKEATAPKEVTVAKTAKKAAIDPKTGDEIVGMDIKLFDSGTDEVVKNDELEHRVRISLSRFLHHFSTEDVFVDSKEDAIKFKELIETSEGSGCRFLTNHLSLLAGTCGYLDLKASITLDESVNGIKKIIVENGNDYYIITENCYSHLDEGTNLVTDKKKLYGQLIKVGIQLLCSVKIGDFFSIYYDSIDIERKFKQLAECIKEM